MRRVGDVGGSHNLVSIATSYQYSIPSVDIDTISDNEIPSSINIVSFIVVFVYYGHVFIFYLELSEGMGWRRLDAICSTMKKN